MRVVGSAGPPASKVKATTDLLVSPWSTSTDEVGSTPGGVSQGDAFSGVELGQDVGVIPCAEVGPGQRVGDGRGVGVTWTDGDEDGPHPASRTSITTLKMMLPTRPAFRLSRGF